MNDTLENGTDSSISAGPVDFADLAISLVLLLPSNTYVLWLILSGAGGGTTASEFFYLNLTSSVILSTLASLFHFAGLFAHNDTSWLNMVASFIFIVFYWFSVPLFQCCICLERYMAVVHPVVFLRYKALRYRVACCCVVWLSVIAFSSFSFMPGIVLLYIFLGFCVVCISALSFCCLSVLRALKQPGPGEGQRDSSSGNDMKRRAFRIILVSLIVMVVTVTCYLPYILCALLAHNSPVADSVTYILIRLSGLFHPFLYIHKAGKLPCFKWLCKQSRPV